MQGSVRALRAVPSYTIPTVDEIKSNNTQNTMLCPRVLTWRRHDITGAECLPDHRQQHAAYHLGRHSTARSVSQSVIPPLFSYYLR